MNKMVKIIVFIVSAVLVSAPLAIANQDQVSGKDIVACVDSLSDSGLKGFSDNQVFDAVGEALPYEFNIVRCNDRTKSDLLPRIDVVVNREEKNSYYLNIKVKYPRYRKPFTKTEYFEKRGSLNTMVKNLIDKINQQKAKVDKKRARDAALRAERKAQDPKNYSIIENFDVPVGFYYRVYNVSEGQLFIKVKGKFVPLKVCSYYEAVGPNPPKLYRRKDGNFSKS